MRTGAAGLLLAAAVLAGCGGEAGDLLAIDVSGGPGGEHSLVVTDNGRGRCDDGDEKTIESDRVIDAREVEREAQELIADGRTFEERAGRRRYRLSTKEGELSWSEGEPGLPEVLPKAQLLALELERELC